MLGEIFMLVFISQCILWVFVTKMDLGKLFSLLAGVMLIALAVYNFTITSNPGAELIGTFNNYELVKACFICSDYSKMEFLLISATPWVGLFYRSVIHPIVNND